MKNLLKEYLKLKQKNHEIQKKFEKKFSSFVPNSNSVLRQCLTTN